MTTATLHGQQITLPPEILRTVGWRDGQQLRVETVDERTVRFTALEAPPQEPSVPDELTLRERLERFIENNPRFAKVSEEERRKYPPVTEEELEEIRDFLSKGKSLSEIVIEERGNGNACTLSIPVPS